MLNYDTSQNIFKILFFIFCLPMNKLTILKLKLDCWLLVNNWGRQWWELDRKINYFESSESGLILLGTCLKKCPTVLPRKQLGEYYSNFQFKL
jgi:hypothetical protein